MTAPGGYRVEQRVYDRLDGRGPVSVLYVTVGGRPFGTARGGTRGLVESPEALRALLGEETFSALRPEEETCPDSRRDRAARRRATRV